VSVPTVTPAPVLILLHGQGVYPEFQDGSDIINCVANGSQTSAIARTHILVAPDAKELLVGKAVHKAGGSRDGAMQPEPFKEGEASDPDRRPTTISYNVEFVASTLVDHLVTFSNVRSDTVRVLGYSQGAALANDILIENDDARITHVVTVSSQLNTQQYHEERFWHGTSIGPEGTVIDYSYTEPKLAPLKMRRVLQIVGGSDAYVPPDGGVSQIKSMYVAWEDRRLNRTSENASFLSWVDSALAYAHAFGYEGNSSSLWADSNMTWDTLTKASYLDGQVVAGRFESGTHIMECIIPLAGPLVNEFLADDPAAYRAPTITDARGRTHMQHQQEQGYARGRRKRHVGALADAQLIPRSCTLS